MNLLRQPGAEPIPGYTLVTPLGTGGFGEVWECVAPGELRKAIKFVYGNLNSLDGDAARPEQEKKALKRLNEVRHPFVLPIERISEVDGELVIVMELADKSLHDLFTEYQNGGRTGIPRQKLLYYLRDAAEGLDYLIEKFHLLHLDVKPRNLFIVGDHVKVADFGLVKSLERQSSSGLMGGVTPIYAAPETFGGRISKQTDQYSLAVVYQELLTGTRPFNGKNIRQLALQHMSEPPDLRPLPEADRKAMARALAKSPDDRFPNCLSFLRALEAGTDEVLPESTRVSSRPSLADLSLEATPAAPPEDPEANSLIVTQAQAEVGTLRPTIVLGVGSFGRRALLELRARLVDRFGDLSQVPTFRYIYIDSDPEAARKAVRGSPDVALSSHDLFPLPLQPPGNYRRRMLDHLNDWLPREKLHAIPRSLQPQGIRALGRLAFSDNYLRLATRLRREIQTAAHPESLSQSVSQTGLGLRDNCPRILVLAAAGGGSGGLLVDLGYALGHLLSQLQFGHAQVQAFLFCGSPLDPATPRLEQANLYATLTELNHYCDPSIRFVTQYGPDGPKIESTGPPYSDLYLLQIENRSPEALRDCIAHLGGYLGHDLTTPLGNKLDLSRQRDSASRGKKNARVKASPARDRTPFRSFGTSSVWYPRGLLLRLAARRADQRLLHHWQAPAEEDAVAAAEAEASQAVTEPGLEWEALRAQLTPAARTSEGSPDETVRQMLADLETQAEQAARNVDPLPWVKQAMSLVREWVGVRSGVQSEGSWRKSQLSLLLGKASEDIAEQWDNHLYARAGLWMEQPGPRLALTEASLQHLSRFCSRAGAGHWDRLQEYAQQTRVTREQLQAALDTCQTGGGFSLFGNRTQRAVRSFLDHLSAFARSRLAEDYAEATAAFYKRLQSRLEERIRDLSFCRQRLRHLGDLLDASMEELEQLNAPGGGIMLERTPNPSPVLAADPFWEALQGSSTVRVVLPNGVADLEEAAAQFLAVVRPEDWRRLDEAIQALVLSPLGGLLAVTQHSADLTRHLASPLIDQTAAFLGELLPVTDVAEAEFSAAPDRPGAVLRIRESYASASPLLPGKAEAEESYLLAPDSPAGQAFGDMARELFPEIHVVSVPTQADLTFCREQRELLHEDLKALLDACQKAYRELSVTPPSSPHSRFDVLEWLPLQT